MARNRTKIAPPEQAQRSAIKIYKTGLYGRLSVLDNGKPDGDPLESQIALMEQFVSQRPYLQYVKLYQDNGFTGTNFRRPGWDRMMKDVSLGIIDCIVVKDLSRLGRNYIESGRFLEKECPRLGIRFISVNDGYDSANADAGKVLAASLKNIVNDFYAKDISRKVCTALATKRKRGEYVGSYAPYGYQKDPNNHNHLIIDPVTAPYVLQIFQWRAEEMGYGTIARRLNALDIPSPGRYRYSQGIITNNNKSGESLLWNRHVLTELLKNPVYIGTLQQGKRRSCLYRGLPEHSVSPSEWDVVCGAHEPIISEELFSRVQEYNDRQKSTYHANYGKYTGIPKRDDPYGFKLLCPDCGKRLRLHRSLATDGSCAYYTYVCPTFLEHREMGCSKKSIRCEDLDRAVLETLHVNMALFLDQQEVLRNLLDDSARRDRRGSRKDVCEKLRMQMERKTELSADLYTDWKAGILTKEEYDFAQETYTLELHALQRQLEEAALERREAASNLLILDEWTKQIDHWRSCEHVTKELVEAFIQSITVDANRNVSIRFHFDDAQELLSGEIQRWKEAT